MGTDDSEAASTTVLSIEGVLDGVVTDDTINRILEIHDESRGLEATMSPPAEERVSYPDDMDAVDRVMHVLVNESLREHSVEWIAQAAALPPDATRVILRTLATAGVVIPPEGTEKEGYQLNPFYEFYKDTRYRTESQYDLSETTEKT